MAYCYYVLIKNIYKYMYSNIHITQKCEDSNPVFKTITIMLYPKISTVELSFVGYNLAITHDELSLVGYNLAINHDELSFVGYNLSINYDEC